MTGSCEFFSTIPMKCVLCRTDVPANTHHRCEVTDEEPQPRKRRKAAKPPNWHGPEMTSPRDRGDKRGL